MHISDVQFEQTSLFGDYITLKINLFKDTYNLLEKYELPNNSIQELFKYESDIKKLLISVCFEGLKDKQKEEMLYSLQKTMFKEL